MAPGAVFLYDDDLRIENTLQNAGPMNFLTKTLSVVGAMCAFAAPAHAVRPDPAPGLSAHKALYDIDLVATRSGSQIINISGKMFYEWKPTCDAWITDHRFNLFYEYADSPGMKITSDFSTYESFDGKSFNFTSRRKRDGTLYQELRGNATVNEETGKATFTMPEGLSYDLSPNMMFPMGHTVEMVRQARTGKRFFTATVFDGSDEDGPIEINTFVGAKANAMAEVKPSKNLDMTLLNTPAWKVRMAVFPTEKPEEHADYEMTMILHENGIISDMLIEYDDFSVTQKLIALEKLEGEKCGEVTNAPPKVAPPKQETIIDKP